MVQSPHQVVTDTSQLSTRGGALVRETRRAPWSPAQLVAVAAGLVLVVIGGVGLARAGLHLSPSVIPLTHTHVAGLGFTSMSALIQLVAGVVLLGGGAYPDTARSTMAVLGVVLVAFGLIVAIDPAPFATMWGFTTASGVFYTVVGAVLLVAVALSPVFSSRREMVARSSDATTATPVDPGTAPTDRPGAPVAPESPILRRY